MAKIMMTSPNIVKASLDRQMMAAAADGNLEKVREITEKYGLSHCKKWLDGYAVLDRALFFDRPQNAETAEFLIKAGAKLFVNDEQGKIHYILHKVVAKSPCFEPIVKLLLTRGASVNARNASGDFPLHCVKYVGIARLLFTDAKSPPDVHAVNSAGRTPLHVAVRVNNIRIIEFLLKNGADVNRGASAEDNFNTPLHDAAQRPAGKQSARDAQALLKAGADINARNSCGKTALHLAVVHHNQSSYLIEALLSWPEVNIDARDNQGNTALAIAADRAYFISLSALLSSGADVDVPNNVGLTPLQIVEQQRSKATGTYMHPSSRSRLLRVSVVLRSHVAKLKCADLPVSERNLMACQCTRYENEKLSTIPLWHTWKTLDDPDFVASCTNEVEKMKNDKIGDSCITYYDVLSGSRGQVANYTKNATVSRAIGSGDSASSKFPLYGRWVAARYRRAKRRAKLQDAALASLSAIFEFLPGLCIDRIIDFLSNEDLLKCSDTLTDRDRGH